MSGINPSDQSELSRLFSGTSAGHCLTCGSEYREVTCGVCEGGKPWKEVWVGLGYDPSSAWSRCPTCQGRGVRTVCSGCGEVAR